MSKGILAAAFISLLMVGPEILATAPISGGITLQLFIQFLLNLKYLALISIIGAMLLIPASLVAVFWKRIRTRAICVFLVAAAYIGTAALSLNVSFDIRERAFHSLAQRSAVLVEAIHSFEVTRGYPPNSLDELVPEFLASIPFTGMAAYPHYQYKRIDEPGAYQGNTWMIEVPASSGPMNFDSFIYLPNQAYPKLGYGGILKRIGAWAYVHE